MGNDPGLEEAQQIDWHFFAELTESAGNLVLTLLMNTIRSVYFEHAEMFRALVARPGELAPLYAAVAQAVAAGDVAGAGDSARQLAVAQGNRLAEAPVAAESG